MELWMIIIYIYIYIYIMFPHVLILLIFAVFLDFLIKCLPARYIFPRRVRWKTHTQIAVENAFSFHWATAKISLLIAFWFGHTVLVLFCLLFVILFIYLLFFNEESAGLVYIYLLLLFFDSTIKKKLTSPSPPPKKKNWGRNKQNRRKRW